MDMYMVSLSLSLPLYIIYYDIISYHIIYDMYIYVVDHGL